MVPDGKLHLTPPDNCPDVVKEMMSLCLLMDPHQRTSFSDILNNLEQNQLSHSNPEYTNMESADERYLQITAGETEK